MQFTDITTQFPPQNDKDFFEMIQFVKQKPFAKDFWNILKMIYKKSEEYLLDTSQTEQRVGVANLMGNFLVRLDLLNHSKDVKSEYPTAATVAYMKRRARRFIKQLGTIDKESYLKIAKQIILNSNNTTNKLVPNSQLVVADILFGNSMRLQYVDSRSCYRWIKSFHLHQEEERFAAYWDEEMTFVQSLIQKDNLADEVYEFAIKLCNRNEWAIPLVNEVMLVRFFNSNSVWLKQLAVKRSYADFSYKTISPELYAGLWLYADTMTQKRIAEINQKRVQNAPDWYKKLAVALSKYTFEMLKNGNANKRVMKSIDFLEKKFPDVLSKNDWTPMAKALLTSPFQKLRNIAFEAMKNVSFDNVLYWLEAWLEKERNIIDDHKEYERFIDIFYAKSPKNIDSDTIKKFIFTKKPNYFLVEFAWHISNKNSQQWAYYTIWNRLGKSQSEQAFIYTCQSPAGRVAFEKYYNYYSYNITYLSKKSIEVLFEFGNTKMQNMFIDKFVENLLSSFSYYFRQMIEMPEHIRTLVLEKTWTGLLNSKKHNIFGYWDSNSVFAFIESNDFAFELIMEIIEKVKLDDTSWQTIMRNIFQYRRFLNGLLQIFADLPDNNPKVKVFIDNINVAAIKNNAKDIPFKYIIIVLNKLNWEQILELVAETDEENFLTIEKIILPILEKKQEEVGFWKSLLEKVIQGENRQLGIRLLENPTFYALFLQQKDLSLIDIEGQEYEELLLQWAEKNTHYFEMNSQNLFKLCMHKIPSVRQFGLQYAEKLGFSLPFALRFFETDTPDMATTAQKYFNQIERQTIEETEAILALCDSPNKNVRQFGLDYTQKRIENLPQKTTIVLECLSEHSDTNVQTFVAKKINELSTEEVTKITKKFVNKFDNETLKIKNRSRKAKEIIKNRIENTLQVETKTLINLARVGTKADKEWAIEQMTKKVLAGEEIEGFVLM